MEVRIQHHPLTDALQIWFYERRGNEYFVASPASISMQKVEEGVVPEATLTVSGMISEEFLQAFADELAKKGIKNVNDHRIAGTLEATREHLSDMRKLVFNHPTPTENKKDL